MFQIEQLRQKCRELEKSKIARSILWGYAVLAVLAGISSLVFHPNTEWLPIGIIDVLCGSYLLVYLLCQLRKKHRETTREEHS